MNTDELKRLAEAATPGPWVAKDWASTDSDGAIDVCGVSVMSPKEMCGIFTVSLEGDERNDVDYIAAANPAAILELIAERDALKATFEHTLAECRDAYPVPEVGSELEGLWGQAMGDPASVGAYVKACANSQKKEINELRAELERIKALPPVAWYAPALDGRSVSYFDGKPMIMVGPTGNAIHTTPLYALGSKT